jgi:hypothetical protein
MPAKIGPFHCDFALVRLATKSVRIVGGDLS